MNENNFIDAFDKTNLTKQTKFRLSEIIGIENYFYQEINQIKSCSRKLNKYVTVFDYIDKGLIVSSATSSGVTSGGVSIISFTSIVAAPVGTASAIFTLIFSLTTGILKKLLNITRNKKKKHDKIHMLTKCEINSIEALIFQTLIDMDINHKEFVTILNEKDKYERMKGNLRSENEKSYEIMTSFRNNIWGVDLADMESMSKYNKGIKYLLCAIDFFSKYT